DKGTMIEVVSFELTDWGRPRPSDQSEGRFRAYLEQFVDPMVYKKGRLITFLGTVGQPEAGKIDDFEYVFPTIQVAGKQLWEERSKQDIQIDYSPLWFRHDFYRPYPYYYPGIRVRTHDGVQRRPVSTTQPQQSRQ
ncbi:starvation-inducible protein, partial [Thalassospira xiamenensis]